MSELKGLIFDFNGVLLWDTHLHDIAWKDYSLKLRGTELSDEEMIHKVHGRTNKDVLEYLVGRSIDGKELQEHIERKESTYRQMCLDNPTEFRLAPGAIEFLDYLKACGKQFTIATSSELGNVTFFFKHLDLGRWFDFDKVAYDDDEVASKPAPDLYLKGASKIGIDPTECIVIEDSRSGIMSAKNANIAKIIALGPLETHTDLSQIEGVDKVITDFNELLAAKETLWQC